MKKIKVLIADDSIVYRSQIRSALSTINVIETIGVASNGRLAIQHLQDSHYDLLILDMEMPEMDGLQTLREMQNRNFKTKIIVFSSTSKRGAESTLEALRLGACDFLTKPDGQFSTNVSIATTSPAEAIKSILEPKIQSLFSTSYSENQKFVSTNKQNSTPVTPYPTIILDLLKPRAVLIGCSTGGPSVLEQIFANIYSVFQFPIFIVQHMPPLFTASLAKRLGKISGIQVKEAEHGETVKNNTVYIAPGDFHMSLTGTSENVTIKLDQQPLINFVRPAVDPLFQSASEIYKDKVLGIILTGMGQDGLIGCQAVKSKGGAVLIQDKESSVVYGMPGAVNDAGAYDKILSPDQISLFLKEKMDFQGSTISAKGGQ